MAYSTSIPPTCLVAGVASQACLWVYNSADVHTDVDAADYFSNGDALGLKVGDIMIVGKNTATVGATLHYVSVVTAGGAATITPAILA